MTPEDHPAGANIRHLEQGVELLRRMDPELYARAPRKQYRGGVGAQLRHCLDFYECFLRDLESGRVDYRRRGRDPRVESDPEFAISRLQEVCRSLRRLVPGQLDRGLSVRAEQTSPGAPEWGRSSGARELQFLMSHTIHHYALIAVLLQLQGFDVAQEFPEFGVAPSTLSHWRETGTMAS